MTKEFTIDDINAIAKVLQTNYKENKNGWAFKIFSPLVKQPLVLNIYNNINLGNDVNGSLISLQTQHGYFELHNCSNFLIFEPDEVIFINLFENKMSSIIISKDGACSMYSNIDQSIINADFSELDPVVLLAAMQLSLTESIIR